MLYNVTSNSNDHGVNTEDPYRIWLEVPEMDHNGRETLFTLKPCRLHLWLPSICRTTTHINFAWKERKSFMLSLRRHNSTEQTQSQSSTSDNSNLKEVVIEVLESISDLWSHASNWMHCTWLHSASLKFISKEMWESLLPWGAIFRAPMLGFVKFTGATSTDTSIFDCARYFFASTRRTCLLMQMMILWLSVTIIRCRIREMHKFPEVEFYVFR